MKKIIVIDLERAFKNKTFYTVILMESVFVILYSFITLRTAILETIPFVKQYIGIKTDFLPGAMYYWLAFNNSPYRSIIFAVLPILCALPFGSAMFSDGVKHYCNQYFIKTKIKNYYISKVVVLFLNGGVIASFPFILSLFLNALFLPIESANPMVNYNFPIYEHLLFSELFLINPVLYCIIFIFWVFISFGLINSIVFAFTFVLSNKFVILISPFFVYFASFVLLEFIKGAPLLWNFVKLNDIKKDFALVGSVQYLAIIVVVALALYVVVCRRKDRL